MTFQESQTTQEAGTPKVRDPEPMAELDEEALRALVRAAFDDAVSGRALGTTASNDGFLVLREGASAVIRDEVARQLAALRERERPREGTLRGTSAAQPRDSRTRIRLDPRHREFISREHPGSGGWQSLMQRLRESLDGDVLVVGQDTLTKMRAYSNPKYGSGGWQGVLRELLARVDAGRSADSERRTRPRFHVVMPRETRERLAKTCFRRERRSGAFSSWRSFEDVMADRHVASVVEAELAAIVETEKDWERTFSFTVVCPDQVGWTSAVQEGLAKSLHVARRALNARASALFVDDDTPAPRTDKVTFIVSVRRERSDVVVFVVSLYPGDDVGPLEGDVSKREGVVFFGWEAPGDDGARWGVL